LILLYRVKIYKRPQINATKKWKRLSISIKKMIS
jgi:hypothetical protein